MEKDFDDIGKRLYDLEADPPSDGWDRLRPLVVKPGNKPVGLKNYWWPPLLLLLPAAFYFMWSSPEERGQSSAALSAVVAHNDSPIRKEEVGASERKDLPAPETEGKAENNKITSTKLKQAYTYSNSSSLTKIVVEQKVMSLVPSVSDTTLSNHSIADNELTLSLTINQGKRDSRMEDENTLANADTTPLYETLLLPDFLSKIQYAEVTERSNTSQKIKGYKFLFSLTPVYSVEASSPNAADEVLITNIKQENKPLQNGFGFTLGLGKVVSKSLSVDAQLSFRSIKNTTQFAYATGDIDTLLAVQQTDQSFLITPLFKISEKEVVAQYTYAGLQLGFNYQVLSLRHSKLSLLGSATTQFLTSAHVKEKINNTWSDLASDDLNKVNLNLNIGLGYAVALGHNWEMMLAPTLSYALKEVGNRNLPYTNSRRSTGLTVLLSKTINR